MRYDFDGLKYREASKHQREWGNSLLDGTALTGSEAVLDLGCGDGSLSLAVAEQVPDGSVLGIDASDGMIGAAKLLEQDNLSFRQLDVDELDYEEEFDLVFSNAALHWITDHRRLLENVFRALKPGGRIAWNFAGSGTASAFIEAVRANMEKAAYALFFQGFRWPWCMLSPGEYRTLLDSSPFREGSVTTQRIDRQFTDAGEITKWIDQPCIVPFLAPLPPEKRAVFRSGVVRDTLARTRQSDGTYLEEFVRLNVRAVKPVAPAVSEPEG